MTFLQTTMKQDDLAKTEAFLAELPTAGPGDYASHDAFVRVLLKELAFLAEKHLSLKDVWTHVSLLIRRDRWYEEAVLHDLSILDYNAALVKKTLEQWLKQAKEFDGDVPDYNILLSISCAWRERCDLYACAEERNAGVELPIFSQANLPRVPERPKPPVPHWVRHVLEASPSSPEEFKLWFSRLARMLPPGNEHIRLAYYDWYMGVHLPDLLLSHMNMLRDMHGGESRAERKERAANCREIMQGYMEAYRAFMEKLKKLMDRAKRLRAQELKEEKGLKRMKNLGER